VTDLEQRARKASFVEHRIFKRTFGITFKEDGCDAVVNVQNQRVVVFGLGPGS